MKRMALYFLMIILMFSVTNISNASELPESFFEVEDDEEYGVTSNFNEFPVTDEVSRPGIELPEGFKLSKEAPKKGFYMCRIDDPSLWIELLGNTFNIAETTKCCIVYNNEVVRTSIENWEGLDKVTLEVLKMSDGKEMNIYWMRRRCVAVVYHEEKKVWELMDGYNNRLYFEDEYIKIGRSQEIYNSMANKTCECKFSVKKDGTYTFEDITHGIIGKYERIEMRGEGKFYISLYDLAESINALAESQT